MAAQTNIEWCDSTLNPWIGCDRISLGCDGCYAAVSTPARTLGVVWGPREPRHQTKPANRHALLRYEREAPHFAAEHGRKRRVFVASLADVMDKAAPQAWRDELWADCEASPNVNKLVLTKRVGNVRRMVPARWLQPGGWPAHVWLGITVVDRREMLRDGPKLAALPVPLRFWSYEPALGPLGEIPLGIMPGWGIAGGESDQGGHKARPMHPEWLRSMRDQFAAAGRPWLFKQWGEWAHVGASGVSSAGECENLGEGCWVWRVGKEAAGRLLDGREHLAWPSN